MSSAPSVSPDSAIRSRRTLRATAPSGASAMRTAWMPIRFATGSGIAPNRSASSDSSSRRSSSGLGQRDAAVDVHLGGLHARRSGRDVGVDGGVDADGRRPDGRRRLALQVGDGLGQQLAVQLEADGGDVARLLVAEQVAGAAQLEVAHRDAKPEPSSV